MTKLTNDKELRIDFKKMPAQNAKGIIETLNNQIVKEEDWKILIKEFVKNIEEKLSQL